MEYEAKFKIKNKKPIIEKLMNLRAVDLGCNTETDLHLQLNNKAVRIRKTGKEGLITIKRLVPTAERAKVREEIQTKVADVDELIRIFKDIGFKEVKRIQKIRHTFKLKRGLVLVDKLPFMGYYIEIETDSFKKLKQISQILDLDYSKAITNSYLNMFVNYIIKNAKKFQNMKTNILPLFENEGIFNKKKGGKIDDWKKSTY